MISILAVDDLHDSADSLVMLLRQLGHVATAAYDGRQAVEFARDLKPDLIFLDINMPRLDGCEAAIEIRRLLSPCPLLVALTAVTDPRARMRIADAGFDQCLCKPADMAAIMKVVTELDATKRAGQVQKDQGRTAE